MSPLKNPFKGKTAKEIVRIIFFSFAWVIFLVFALDLLSKWLVVGNMSEYQQITIIENFFYIRLTFNQGAAFGLGNTGDVEWRIFFIAVSMIMGTAMLIYYIVKHHTLSTISKIALAMMIAGAYGNLIDRALYWPSIVGFSGVVDFLSFEFWGSRFATFNIADSSLVVGVIILILGIVIDDIKAGKQKQDKDDLSKPAPEYLAEKKKDQDEQDPQH
ncbi:MAG: signal peptidase II [Bacteroidia bacterium]|nr:signal peptidase II [Bacteroidia bacterium]